MRTSRGVELFPDCSSAVAATISELPGVGAVLDREEAARNFRLLPDRIGELVVLGDHETVFGDLDGDEIEQLEDGYRSHGSLHERTVPLITYNTALPEPPSRESNAELLAPMRTALA